MIIYLLLQPGEKSVEERCYSPSNPTNETDDSSRCYSPSDILTRSPSPSPIISHIVCGIETQGGSKTDMVDEDSDSEYIFFIH